MFLKILNSFGGRCHLDWDYWTLWKILGRTWEDSDPYDNVSPPSFDSIIAAGVFVVLPLSAEMSVGRSLVGAIPPLLLVFGHSLRTSGMLHAKLLPSPGPHCKGWDREQESWIWIVSHWWVKSIANQIILNCCTCYLLIGTLFYFQRFIFFYEPC